MIYQKESKLTLWFGSGHLRWIRRYLLELSLLPLLLYVVATKEIILTVALNGEALGTIGALQAPRPGSQDLAPFPTEKETHQSVLPTAYHPGAAATASNDKQTDAAAPNFNDVALTDDPAPHISNLTLILSPDYAQRKQLSASIVRAKRERVQNYVDRYAAAAQAEMRQFGVPASITLAQGLLESNAGDSKLARQSNNHFGIKCRRKCRGCTCRNYSDDTHYDMFRVFDSPGESFREHSELLQLDRYRKLKKYGKDYRKWAHGLKSAGYATDKRYAHKLIQIVERLRLDRYDVVEPGV